LGDTELISNKVKFKPLDILIIIFCIGAGIYVFFRIKYGLEYKGDWSVIPRFLFRRDTETGRVVPNILMQGLFATLKLSIWATILAIILGLIFGLFRTSKNLFLKMVGRTYVELIRNLPPLVLIFIFYFFVIDQIMPIFGLEEFIRSRTENSQAVLAILFAKESLFVQFISGVITIAFFEGAYITEIVRAGIESVERGQREAAYSLGLSWFDQMRFIIMPQALRRVLPPLANEFINTIKYSSLASLISIQELTFSGRQVVAVTRNIFETWITVAVMYLALTLSLSLLVGRLEQRMKRSD
jgi:polar amino acid transport system permease protein